MSARNRLEKFSLFKPRFLRKINIEFTRNRPLLKDGYAWHQENNLLEIEEIELARQLCQAEKTPLRSWQRLMTVKIKFDIKSKEVAMNLLSELKIRRGTTVFIGCDAKTMSSLTDEDIQIISSIPSRELFFYLSGNSKIYAPAFVGKLALVAGNISAKSNAKRRSVGFWHNSRFVYEESHRFLKFDGKTWGLNYYTLDASEGIIKTFSKFSNCFGNHLATFSWYTRGANLKVMRIQGMKLTIYVRFGMEDSEKRICALAVLNKETVKGTFGVSSDQLLRIMATNMKHNTDIVLPYGTHYRVSPCERFIKQLDRSGKL